MWKKDTKIGNLNEIGRKWGHNKRGTEKSSIKEKGFQKTS